jgi:hypothetical protein
VRVRLSPWHRWGKATNLKKLKKEDVGLADVWTYEPISLNRMVSAVEKVRDRLLRATAALEGAGVRYAVAGGNAIAAWVTTTDEAAVRNTQKIDTPED